MASKTPKKSYPAVITSGQKQALRALAHPLKPVIHVGQYGVTDAVVVAVSQALLDHELIKIRLHEPIDKRTDAAQLAEKTGSTLCALLGHTVILYRPHPEKPRIVI